MKNYQIIAQNLIRLAHRAEDILSTKSEMHDIRAGLIKFVREHFPSGSGVDNGTELNWDKTSPEHLVFNTAFHHMDENGTYDGWTHHEVHVSASLSYGIKVRVTGQNRNNIKEYLEEIYDTALEAEQEYVNFETLA